MGKRSTAWFAPKQYGYGAGSPISWQGWLAMAVFLAAIALVATMLEGGARVVATVLLVVGFVLLARAKTQGGWRWRWGE